MEIVGIQETRKQNIRVGSGPESKWNIKGSAQISQARQIWLKIDRETKAHVTSRPVSFPPHLNPEGMFSRSIGMPSRREGPPSIWDTHGISGNVFVNPDASSSAPYPQELNQWNSSIKEPLHSSTVEK